MSSFRSTIVTVLLAAVLLAALVVPASARLSGAVWTSTVDGDKVNANHYDQKEPPGVYPYTDYTSPPPLVPYLNGGPQFMHGSWMPDGLYYFQVTDPAGKVCLSNDDIANRLFRIATDGSGNKYVEYPVADYLADYTYIHHTGTDKYTGVVTICLWPYDDTPNNGGVYKLWVTMADKYVAPGDEGYDKTKCGFIPSNSKTDNFKVRQALLAGVEGRKVDTSDEGVLGLHIILDVEVKVKGVTSWEPIADTVTDPDGYYSFVNLDVGKYQVREDLAGTEVVPGSDVDPTDIVDYSGWVAVGPTAIQFNITKGDLGKIFKGVPIPGTVVSLRDFVNEQPYPPLAALRGYKFFDVGKDGMRDAEDFALSGWTITLEEWSEGAWQQAHDHGGVPVDPVPTGEFDGSYNFSNLDAGKVYRICEVQDPAWLQTAPGDDGQVYPPAGPITVDPDTEPVEVYVEGQQYIVDLTGCTEELTVVGNLDFGNTLADLCVQKWMVDATGAPVAPGEGFVFELFEADGVTPVTTDGLGNAVGPIVTNADGVACWHNLLGGDYVVKEVDFPGIVLVDPELEKAVTVEPGQSCTDSDSVVFHNYAIVGGLTPGYWKNWRNHYTDAQFEDLLDGTIASSIAEADAIFEHWDASPDNEQSILQAFLLADQLTINLTTLFPGYPNPSGGSLVPLCVVMYDGELIQLGDVIAIALDMVTNPGDYTRDEVLQIKNMLGAFMTV